MKIDYDTRDTIMNVIRSEILHAGSAIEFYDLANLASPVCTLPFDALDTTGAPGNVEYQFSKNSNVVLRNDCNLDGDVSVAYIRNNSNSIIITASVGDVGSLADIVFNKRQWTIGMIVTVNNLRLVIPEGI